MSQTQITTNSLKNSSVTSEKLSSSITIGTLGVTGNFTVDTNTLFVDSVNGRVGVGTISPTELLNVNGNMRFEGHSLLGSSLPSRHTVASGFKGFWTGANSSLMASTVGGYEGWTLNSNVVRGSTDWVLQDTTKAGWSVGSLYGSSADNFFVQRTPPSSGNVGSSLTSLFYINSSGNVGIGTASPNSTLDVVGNITASTSLKTTTGQVILGGNTGLNVGGGGGGNNDFWAGASNSWTSMTYGGTAVTKHVFGNGNVGIGTSIPSEKFHVYGSGNQKMFVESSDTGSAQFKLKNSTTAWHFEAWNNAFNFVESNVDTRLTILEGGNVGIGTTSPSYKLDVNGTGNFAGNVTMLGDLTVDTNTLKVDSVNGRVGIGTSSPSVALHVSGSSNEARIRIQNTAGDPVLEMQGTSGTSYLFTRGSNWHIRTDSNAKHIKLQVGDAVNTQGKVQIGSGSSNDGLVVPASQLVVRGNTNVSTTGLLDIQSYSGSSRLFALDSGEVGIGTTTPTATLQVNGSLALSYIEKTANYTLTSSDHTVNCTTNSFIITLPTAVGITGRVYFVKNTGTGTITVDADSTETIDGELTQILTQWDSMQIQSTGSNWIIL